MKCNVDKSKAAIFLMEQTALAIKLHSNVLNACQANFRYGVFSRRFILLRKNARL